MSDLDKQLGNLSPEKRSLLAKRLGEKPKNDSRSASPRRLQRKPAGNVFPLSFAQERLWFLDKFEGPSALYNITLVFRLAGRLQEDALKQACRELVNRHETLRTTFEIADEKPVQVIHPVNHFLIVEADWAAENEPAEIERLVRAEAQRPFDLIAGPLFRVNLWRECSPDGQNTPAEYVLLINMHHIIVDAWSISVLIDDLTALYGALVAGQASRLTELMIQYADYAVWQRDWLQGEELERQVNYWKRQLAGAPELLELPGDHPRPALLGYKGSRLSFPLNAGLTAQLRRLARENNTTLFMVLYAAFALLLGRYSGREDLVIGTPIANRQRVELEPLIGFFINTLALRADLSRNPTFLELLERVRQMTLAAYAHQAIPFEKLVQELQPTRNLSYTPLFQVMIVLQNAPEGIWTLPDVIVTALTTDTDVAQFDLTLSLVETGEELIGTLEYSTLLFEADTMQRMAECFEVLLDGIVSDPGRRVSDLPVLSAGERERMLVEWNETQVAYAQDKCVHELFEEQVERTPDGVAVVFAERQLSYRELNERANQLGHYLQKQGVGPDVLVGICMERSLEMVIGLLGILKAGGAYVPIDPAYPQERVAYMLADAHVAILLTQERLLERMPQHGSGGICLDRDWPEIAREDMANPSAGVLSGNLAYTIYTSGSTGKPKGAMNTHGGIRNRLLWMQAMYQLTEADRVLQKTPFSFDVSVWEFFWPLIVGARLVMAAPGRHGDPAYLVKTIIAQGITALHFVPAMLQVFLDQPGLEACDSLKRVICSGEELTIGIQSRFFSRLQGELHNLYGPTEAAVDVTYWSCQKEAEIEIVPIGRPIANTEMYILDGGQQPVPIGVAGELYIAGKGLARGYLNRPELTAEKFVPNPFGNEAGARMYRTGDLARYRADGNIEYLGRIDQQVKIRGFRIELGEIEAVLGQHADVRACAVLAREDHPGNKQLVGYIVAQSGRTATTSELRSFLTGKLPEYMVPGLFVMLDELPLTPNGKVDRKALPAPSGERPELSTGFVAARTPTEELLAGIWADVLRVERVGVHDNFFELGGHSLLAVSLVERMRREGLHTDVRTLFKTPTLSALAQVLSRESYTIKAPPNLIPGGCEKITPEMLPLVSLTAQEIERVVGSVAGGVSNVQDIYPLAPLQEGILFHHLMVEDGDPYLLEAVYTFDSRERMERYLEALQAVIDRHDILRTAVVWDGLAEPVQVVWRKATLVVNALELNPGDGEIIEQLQARFNPRHTRLDISQAPLKRLFVAEDRENKRWVLLELNHHLITDHETLRFIHAEIEAHLLGDAQRLAAPVPFRNFVAQARLGVSVEEHEVFFRRMLGDINEPTVPFGLTNVQGDGRGIEQASRKVETDLAKRLRRCARELGVSAVSLHHLAWALVLARVSGRVDVVFGTVMFGRLQGEEGAGGVMGLVINTLPVRIRMDDETAQMSVRKIHETLTQLIHHEHAPLALAQRCSGVAAPAPLFTSLLNYRHSGMEVQTSAEEQVRATRAWQGIQLLGGEERTNYPLAMSVDDLGEGFELTVQVEAVLDPGRICEFMHKALEELAGALERAPETPLRRLDILPAAERDQVLVEWNDTNVAYPHEKCVHELFEEQVERTPDAVAVVFAERQLSYRELNERANQLGHYLRKLGVGPDVLVGICVERSLEMVVGLLGILKAGGAYVPLDPAYPKERLAFMIDDTNIRVILTSREQTADFFESWDRVVYLDSEKEITAQDVNNVASHALPEHLAYIMYTSGSTGKPKGISISHRAINRLVFNTNYIQIKSDDRIAQASNASFDAGTFEIWGALLHGAQLVGIAKDVLLSPHDLATKLSDQQITILFLTTALFHQCAQEMPTAFLSLRTILFGGERVDPRWVSEVWREGNPQQLLNMYGPTEATTFALWHLVRGVDVEMMTVPIGRPIANTQVYILDGELQPVPIGVVGELYIAGDGLARGYLNRPELTAEKFVPNPFGSEAGARMYRTGDLARYRADGNIEFLGRIDSQVKIRGFRIELGEIEAVLGQHPDVQACVLLAREDRPGDKQLVGYIVPQSGRTAATSELRSFLTGKLPEYMVPGLFVMLDELPLTPNGKVDRKALPAPSGARPDLEKAYMPPRSEVERMIAVAWQEVLQVDKVGVHDNFFDLGGHSLLMARVYYQLREQLSGELSMVELFRYPTISTLAEYIRSADQGLPISDLGARRAALRRTLAGQPEEGIAVIGLAGRFPGARNVDEFWQNLCAGKESISFFSESELRAAGVDDATLGNPDYVRAGSVLENTEEFDAFFFGYNPREAAVMDPQQRVFLESAWEALEQVGYDAERYEGRIGVYGSVSASSYMLNHLGSNRDVLASIGGYQAMLGNDKDFLTTRVSYKLNLKGPSINVQTACSSSLVAVHLACQGLLAGESDMALAGGVSISLPQGQGYLYEEGGIASPDGHCRAFDAGAKGTVGGNGVGVVVLKRLSEALADGDVIHAVIRGTAINNDGGVKVGYTAPSVEGQVQVIAEAQAVAGVSAETITYVEAHGTGTELGDPIEMAALTQAFGRENAQQTGYCALGSVKTNIGHLDAAAGVTGLIKTVLALKHRAIPASLHYERANPKIDFEHSPFYVNTELREWQAGVTPRRAGVSSFGIGGTNAHAVLEEAPAVEASGPGRPWQLLVLSAKTATALEAATSNLAEHLKTAGEQNLADAAYTLQVGRQIMNHRRVVVCRDADDAASALEKLDAKRVWTGVQEHKGQGVAFMFTGQGAQYVDMGRELYEMEPVFREQVDRCADLLEPMLGLDLRTVIYPEDADRESAAEQLVQTWLTQPALFVIEYALAQLWMWWGVKPEAMIGHSIGEYVAACLAGVFSLEDALVVVAARGRLMQALAGGGMLAVQLAEAEIRAKLGGELSLAAVNGAELCVVSGTKDAIALLEEELGRDGVACQRLQTSHAFHSAMMEPMVEAFCAIVGEVGLRAPEVAFVSNVTGEWITAAEATDPAYWGRHLRQTVRFGEGLGRVLEEAGRVLLEIGPGRTLSSLAAHHPAKGGGQTVLASLPHRQERQSEQAFLLGALGRLWLAGVGVDWSAFHQGEHRHRVPLPTYPFERQRCWIEPSKTTVHSHPDRIYKKQDIADWFYIPSWTPSPVWPRVSGQIPENCLVFMDSDGLGLDLVEHLKQKGMTITTVLAGDGWRQLGDARYILNPGHPDDYHQLLRELAEMEKTPDTIIHLWSLTREGEQYSGREYFAQVQPLGFYSLLYLAQALDQQRVHKSVHIEVVSNGIYALEKAIQPEKATLLGPCKVIPQELTYITCRYVDIVVPPQGTRQAARLINQLAAGVLDEPSNGTFVWRDGERWEQSFKPVHLAREMKQTEPLRENGVYLITGGLGSIGLTLAEYLARQVRARIVLTERSAFPKREEWEELLSARSDEDDVSRKIRRVRAMEELGTEVIILEADVADQEAMQSVISEIYDCHGTLNGVFHAAGVIQASSHSVQEITETACEGQFRPKIHGLFVLDQVLQGRELDFCLLLSSLSSVLGGLESIAYSAANNFMDAKVRKQSQQSSARWISLNLDRWQTDEAQKSAKIARSNIAELVITPEQGMEAVQRSLAAEQFESQIVISVGDLQARINQWVKLEVLREGYQKQAAPILIQSRPPLANAYAAPRNEIEQTLAAIWQDLLGIEQVGIDDNFFDLGGHSLLGTQVISELRQVFQVEPPLQTLFEAPSIAGFAEILIRYEAVPGQIEAIARLRNKINQLSPEEIRTLLHDKKQNAGKEEK